MLQLWTLVRLLSLCYTEKGKDFLGIRNFIHKDGRIQKFLIFLGQK